MVQTNENSWAWLGGIGVALLAVGFSVTMQKAVNTPDKAATPAPSTPLQQPQIEIETAKPKLERVAAVPKAAKHQKTSAHKGAGIQWMTSITEALEVAKRTHQPIMIDFYAPWCGPCKMLDEEVYTDKSVIQASRKWIMVKIDGSANDDIRQQYGVEGYPMMLFLKYDGSTLKRQEGLAVPVKYQTSEDRINGFLRSDFLQTLRQLHTKNAMMAA